MFNDDLIEIFDLCVTRLEHGESIDTCLQSYPRYADTLYPMLEAVEIPRVAQAPMGEVELAKEHVGLRFEQALNQSYRIRQPQFSFARIAAALVMLFFVGSLLTTGVVVAAQGAIPGDTLYGVKRLSEQVRLAVALDGTALREEFAQRRIEETRQVINIGRKATVQFKGTIEQIGEMSVEIAGLQVDVTSDIRNIGLMKGMRVDVTAQTNANHQIIASDIRILDMPEPIVQPDATPTNVDATSTFTPTVESDTPTPTERVESNRSPSNTPHSRITATPTPTATETTVTVTRPGSSPTRQTPAATTSAREECTPPSDWIEYTIQPGDTPSGIAVGTDLSLEELYAVNCDMNPRLIVVGDVIYVPFEPRLALQATHTVTPYRGEDSANPTSEDRSSDATQASRPNPTEDTQSNGGDSKQNRNRNNNSGSGDGKQRGR